MSFSSSNRKNSLKSRGSRAKAIESLSNHFHCPETPLCSLG